jgi:peroxiredoxin
MRCTCTGRTLGVFVGLAVIGMVTWGAMAGSGEEPKKNPPADTSAGVEVGQPAPDFTGKDLEGKEHKLSDLKGKVVVLEWSNHECPFIIRHEVEKKTMQKTYAQFKDKGVVWLSVNSSNFCADKADAIKAFVKTNGIEYPILLDPEGKIGKLYQAKSTPHMFVIDKTGAVAYAGAIDDDPQGKAEKATNYVADAVQALLDGKPVAVKSTKPYGCSVKYKG